MIGSTYCTVTAHSVLNVRAALEWGNSELYKYYERNGLGYGTVHCNICIKIVIMYFCIEFQILSSIDQMSEVEVAKRLHPN